MRITDENMRGKILIVDTTHGGVKLATEFSKLNCEVYAWDIYHTLSEEQKKQLQMNDVKLVDEGFLGGNKALVVAPIHSNLNCPVDMTHHDAVAYLLKEEIKIPMIEVTGVKGKTTVVHMLREIFKDSNPLILTSLGVEIRDKLLERNISITPASIITTWELGQKYNPGIFILETSLGGTGLAQVGVLTNIAEDYSIASGTKTASQAKEQIFKDELVACDYDSYQKYYTQHEKKTNTFGLTEGNVKARDIKYGLTETSFRVEVQGLKTVFGEILDDSFSIRTFAPAPYHVENVLSAICASLTCGRSVESVKSGLENFHGLKGRTTIKHVGNTTLIEEINPGINVTAVKRAIGMVEHLPRSAVIFGGQYGVTCEEIDEESVSRVLDELELDIGLILTDELGASVKDRITRNLNYLEECNDAVEYARAKGYRNVLLIYRSNLLDLEYR